MDEPFGSLDAVTRAELHREFRNIQKAVHKTCLLVTHDIREAAALADRIAVLDGGTLAACGTPHEILRSRVAAIRSLIEP
jgi:osmoprotectant transport system ATP-binding protein